jgi:GNAT superfamily N-acetyltransferase
MIYRNATPDDIEAIVAFQLAMAQETEDLRLDGEVCSAGVAAVFKDAARGRFFVGERDGAVVGSAMITYEWSDWRNGVVWWIQSVYVLPRERRKGVYGGLYAHIQRLARESSDVRGIRLYVDRRNTAAQEVYAKLGMNGEHYQVFEWMKE